MADSDASRLKPLLIVTGSTLRAEEMDRPLAYYLKQQVDRIATESGADRWKVVVITDVRWLHDEPLQTCPTISIGGPGVNSVAHRLLEDLPVVLAVDEQFVIQFQTEAEEEEEIGPDPEFENLELDVDLELELTADDEEDPDDETRIASMPASGAPRASVWGMDNAQTQIAVAVFARQFLPRFLEQSTIETGDCEDQEDELFFD